MALGAVSFGTRVALWGRSGAKCAFPGCKTQLVMWAEEALDPSLVADVCHIAAKEKGGARYVEAMSDNLRNAYGNLVLLCKIHHKFIDDNEPAYPVERVREIKNTHEQWVADSLSKEDVERQSMCEQYTALIQEWEEKALIADWENWANNIVSWYPSISIKIAHIFDRLPNWIDTRWWPKKLPLLEAAIVNYAKWLRLTLSILYRHTRREGDEYFTPKFYQIDEWDEEKYERLANVWQGHLELLERLMIEVCKSANLVAFLVRSEISSSYRHEEGKFSLDSTFTGSDSMFSGVFEYSFEQIGDGFVFLRSDLYGELTKPS